MLSDYWSSIEVALGHRSANKQVFHQTQNIEPVLCSSRTMVCDVDTTTKQHCFIVSCLPGRFEIGTRLNPEAFLPGGHRLDFSGFDTLSRCAAKPRAITSWTQSAMNPQKPSRPIRSLRYIVTCTKIPDQYCAVVLSIIFFIHLKLALLTQFPASNYE